MARQAVRRPRAANPQKEVSRRIVGNKEMERPSQYTAQGHCYPSPTHPRYFRFSYHPFFQPVQSARAPTSPMNKTRRIQRKSCRPSLRIDALFFHLAFVSDTRCVVYPFHTKCTSRRAHVEPMLRDRNENVYGLLSKI